MCELLQLLAPRGEMTLIPVILLQFSVQLSWDSVCFLQNICYLYFVLLINIKTRHQFSLTLLVLVAGNDQFLPSENCYLAVSRHILPDVIGYKLLLVLVNAEPLVNCSEHQTRPS